MGVLGGVFSFYTESSSARGNLSVGRDLAASNRTHRQAGRQCESHERPEEKATIDSFTAISGVVDGGTAAAAAAALFPVRPCEYV